MGKMEKGKRGPKSMTHTYTVSVEWDTAVTPFTDPESFAKIVGSEVWQVPTDFDPCYNQVQVQVTVSPAIPPNRNGAVYLEWYDPSGENSSRGSLEFVGNQTLELGGDSAGGTRILEFPNDCFGDQFIVAVHPHLSELPARPAVPQHPNTVKTSQIQVLSWQGFDFKDKWTAAVTNGPAFVSLTNSKWIFDKDATGPGTMRTPLPTISATQSENTEKANLALTPLSVLEYPEAFKMVANFDFVGEPYVNAYSSPTQAHPKNPHRSFHRNSGVKIYGLFEMQIYDTAALLAEQPNLDTAGTVVTNWQDIQSSANGIKKNGDTSYESISGCVTNIPYLSGRWHTATITELQQVAGRNQLDFDFIPNEYEAGTFTIATRGDTGGNDDGDGRYDKLKFGTGSKYKDSVLEEGVKKLHLQTHWGSGVLFKNITITKPQ